MTASSAPISTVSSSETFTSSRVPATGEGISVSTLSVEISSSGSSTATSSPTSLSQRVTVPSVTDSPSSGRVTVVPRRRRTSWSRRRASRSPRAACRPHRPDFADSGVSSPGGRSPVSSATSSSCSAFFSASSSSAGSRLGRGGVVALGVVARGLALVTDDGEERAHLDGVVLVDLDLEQRARDRRGDLGVDLVGGDLEQRLVDGDGVADLLQPARDGALGDGLTQFREVDFGGQCSSFARGLRWECSVVRV